MFLERQRQERLTELFSLKLTFTLKWQHGIFGLDRSSENSLIQVCFVIGLERRANMPTARLGGGVRTIQKRRRAG
jgi:hypothetical protein